MCVCVWERVKSRAQILSMGHHTWPHFTFTFNNQPVIHITPVHQLTSCEDKSCVFVRNKSIKTFLTSNHCFQLKYEPIIHNNASSSEKVHLLVSLTSKSTNTYLFRTVLASKQSVQISLLIQTRPLFALEEALLLIMDLKMPWWIRFLQTFSFWLLKMLTDGLEWCGLWCFYLFGLLFWRHPFTAEDPLLSKWCNATFLQICSDEETNSSTSWMTWGWGHSGKFILAWTIPLIKDADWTLI